MSDIPDHLVATTAQYRTSKHLTATAIARINNAVAKFPKDAIIFKGDCIEMNDSKIPAAVSPIVKEFLDWLASQAYTNRISGVYSDEVDHRLKQQVEELQAKITRLEREKVQLGSTITSHEVIRAETARFQDELKAEKNLNDELRNEIRRIESESFGLKSENRTMRCTSEALQSENTRLKQAVTKHEQSYLQQVDANAAMTIDKQRVESENEALVADNDQLRGENARLKTRLTRFRRDKEGESSMPPDPFALVNAAAGVSASILLETPILGGAIRAVGGAVSSMVSNVGSKKRAREED